jgi:hypothetical protein
MTMNKEHKGSPIELPPDLVAQLRGFEKRLCFMETLAAGFGGLCGVLLTYLLLFVSDRFWDTPGGLRALLTAAGGITFAVFASKWTNHWLVRRRNTRDLARIVQRKYRRLGDRLLGAVELAGDAPGHGSPALCRAAIRQVAEEARRYDFRGAVEKRRTRIYSLSFAILIVLAAVPFAVFPKAGLNALTRWANPLSTVHRYTFVRLEDMPAEKVVPHGEPFEIACDLADQSVWRPVSGACRIEDQPRIDARIESGRAVFDIPGQVSAGMLTIRIGDVSRRMRIVPMYRPELLRLDAVVDLPYYLSRPQQQARVEGNRLDLLKGSMVSLSGRANRDLDRASMLAPEEESLAVEKAVFNTQSLAAEDLGACAFRWRDVFGLDCAAPYPLETTVVKDGPPSVRCRGISRAVAILEDEVVEMDVVAGDDYGVRNAWVDWRSDPKPDSGVPGGKGSVNIGEGGPEQLDVSGKFSFSPIAMHVPEETTARIRAAALDYYPGRKPTQSPEYQVYVLSRAQHSRLIQDQMQNLQARLEDLAREEENLIQRNLEVGARKPEDRDSKRTTDELRESVQLENRNRQQLSQLARDVEKLTKEGMRNKDIGEQTLREWSEMAQTMKQVASGAMQQAAKSLQNARQSGQQQRGEEVEKAVESEKRALQAMRDMESGINDSIEQMVAQNFVNRLKQAARKEDDVADALKALLPKIIGLSTNELPAKALQELRRLAAGQGDNKMQVAYIRDDLAGFFNRTRLEPYQKVHTGIVESGIVHSLGELAVNISRNVGANSIAEARDWATQLRAWAGLLQEEGVGGGGGGEGSGTPEQVDIEVLIALMRARMREESLREQTRLLDQGRSANRRYSQDSRKLSDKQYDLARDTRPLERKVSSPRARKLIEKVGGEMMNAGMYLRKPQTDTQTVAIETEIIELLANAIQATSGQGGAMAQSLMAAAGMSPGGGGSTAGGKTGLANESMSGEADGGAGEERNVDKAVGVDRSSWPEEFREALEGYFNSLESEQ